MLRWNKNKSAETSGGPAAPSVPPAHPAPDRTAPAPQAGSEPSAPKKDLPQLLLDEGALTEEQLQKALALQKESGDFIGEILIREGILDEKSLLSFLAKHCKIPHLSLLDYLIDKSIIGVIPQEICFKYRLLPIDKMGNNLTVAMVNPLDTEALQKVKECCPSLRIKPILCAYNHFETVSARLFGSSKSGEPAELSATSLGLRSPKKESKPAPPPAPEKVAPPPPSDIPEPVPEIIPEALEAIPEALEAEAESVPAPKPPPLLENVPPAGITPENVLHSVFQAPVESASEPPPAPAPASGSAQSDSSILMREMAAVMMDSMRDTYAMLARRMELFHGLSPEDVARIFARGSTREYEEGEVVFQKGQPGAEMFVILGGEIRIFDGEQEIALLGRGDMFGEMALVSNEPRSAGAAATCTTSLLELSLDDLKKDLPREVSLQLLVNIIITLSDRLRRANAE
ncbi:MAG TPA: cyclic nucleotide-binding domain-containing protein [Candidatus Hydrogenedentes bacterium]|nr:cyclic nucleotide-binding domain-containing protein [Candidatus Hydrogenedentota bacterium]